MFHNETRHFIWFSFLAFLLIMKYQNFFKDKNFIKFKKECSKTGTTEEAIAIGEKIGFKTNLIAINPLNPNQKVPVFLQILYYGLWIWCCFWLSGT